MSDQFVHDRTDLIRIAPLDPAGQLGQRDRTFGFAEHVDDPIRQGVLQRLGDPPGPSMVHHVAFEGVLEPKVILDPGLADDVVENCR